MRSAAKFKKAITTWFKYKYFSIHKVDECQRPQVSAATRRAPSTGNSPRASPGPSPRRPCSGDADSPPGAETRRNSGGRPRFRSRTRTRSVSPTFPSISVLTLGAFPCLIQILEYTKATTKTHPKSEVVTDEVDAVDSRPLPLDFNSVSPREKAREIQRAAGSGRSPSSSSGGRPRRKVMKQKSNRSNFEWDFGDDSTTEDSSLERPLQR